MKTKNIPIIIVSFLIIVTIGSIMMFRVAQVPQTNVGGPAQRWSYSTSGVTASSTSVTSTATLLIATSTSPDILKFGEFMNTSSTVVYICAFEAACTTSNGQPLVQYGYKTIDDEDPWQGSVYAITSAGSATMSIRTVK